MVDAPASESLWRTVRGLPQFWRLLELRTASQFGDGLFQAGLAGGLLFNPERAADPWAVAGAFAVLFLSIVLGPYRRGEVWAWWSLAGSLALLVAIVAARVPVLGTQLGVGSALILAGLAGFGLLLDASRLKGR